MPAYKNSLEHLFAELHRLDLILNLQVTEQRSDPAAPAFNEFRGLFMAEDEIDQLIQSDAPRPNVDENTTRSLTAIQDAITAAEKAIAESVNESLKLGIDLSLPRLARLFELSPFDVDTLLICLAPELDLKYEKLYAYLQNDVTRKHPTTDLILKLCCRSLGERLQARARFLAPAPLIRHQLIQQTADTELTGLLSRGLKIDGRILNYLLKADTDDERIDLFATFLIPQVDIERVLLPRELKERLVNCFVDELGKARRGAGATLFILEGPVGAGKSYLTEALCRHAGRNLITTNAAGLLAASPGTPRAIATLFREATLRNAVVVIDQGELLTAQVEKDANAANELVNAWRSFAGLVVINTREPWSSWRATDQLRQFRFPLPLPDFSLRRELWRQMLAEDQPGAESELDLAALADRFILTPGKIRRAITEAKRLEATAGGDLTSGALNQACRDQTSVELPALARKINPLFNWNDIILPRDCLEHLREVCAHIRHRQKVFSDWAFATKVSLGKGVGILFAGPSGTGKTMAAEIIANELALDLYKIDLSCIVSKYIGETEKNLSRVFAGAEQSNAILFFDEADAIFGKRSEVRDSHDRYANIEVNYLLQKMEEYEGVVILASNLQKNIDDAFTRRLRFIIEFPFPEEDYRARIWHKVFPVETPLATDVDFDFLARKLKFSGGNIRNVALHAAFLAAANSGHVSMEHIVCAARREFQKMGRLCVKSDFEQYFELIEPEEVTA